MSIGLESSSEIRLARLDSLSADSRWRAVRAGRFPQIRLSGDIPSLSESLDEALVYDPDTDSDQLYKFRSRDTRWQGWFDIGQDLPWGASLDITSRLYRRDWKGRLLRGEDKFTEYSLQNRFTVRQPLLEGNPVRREQITGKLSWQSSMINYEVRRRDIVYRITSSFFGLVSSWGSLQISKQDLEQGKESEVLAQRKLAAGLIPEVELLQIQVDVARREGSYRQTLGAWESSVDNLCITLGIPLDRPIVPVYNPPQNVLIEEQPIFQTGTRPELKRVELDLQRTEMETKYSIQSERIRAYLYAYYEIDTRSDSLSNLTDFGDRNVGVMLHFEFPLFGFGSTKGRIEALKYSLSRERISHQTRIVELEAEYRDALRRLERAMQRIRIARAAVDLSDKGYAITAERFENGLIDSRDLIAGQMEITRTRSELLSAQIEYELALAYLEKIAPLNE